MALSDRILTLAVLGLGGFVACQAISVRSGGADARAGRLADAAARARDSAIVDPARIDALYESQRARFGNAAPPRWMTVVQARRSQSLPGAPARDEGQVAALVRSDGPGTYLDDVLTANRSVLVRWPARDGAVHVWLEPRPAVPRWQPGYLPAVRAAFAAWRTEGLRFDFVDDSTQADVHVTWVERFPEGSRQIGSTFRLTDEHGWVGAASVVLATHLPDGRPLDAYAVQNAALHEAGHVVGLDHSRDRADVMATSTTGRQDRLTDRDRRTARLLYQLPPGFLPRVPGTPARPEWRGTTQARGR